MICNLRPPKRPSTICATAAAWLLGAALSTILCLPAYGAGETPNSPNVRRVVDAGLKFLEGRTDPRLGGKCLVALAFLKAGKVDHPKIREALAECAKVEQEKAGEQGIDNYSNGLAIILLCELSAQKHSRSIDYYLSVLKTRQKPNGGWGYSGIATGDTSQTQYAALSYWEAHRFGFKVDAQSVERLANWLVKTQAPDGSWGYQGQVSPNDEPIPQDEATCSLLAAENEEQVARFLASAPGFAPVPVATLWPQAVGGAGPGGAGDWLRLTPARDGCDGFFVAVLGRAAKAAAAEPEAEPEAEEKPEAEEGPEAEAPAA